MRKIMKQFFALTMIITLVFSFTVNTQKTYAADEGYNELLGDPIAVYGAKLSDSELEEVKRLLEVDPDAIQEFEVDGQDAAKYINGNPNSNMYSSVKITQKDKGNGIVINIVTPENITQVTSDMYKNALLTAGVEDAVVDVASPVQVSGHSALTGIYKAYDAGGAELDEDRMEVANEELDLTTELTKKEGMSEEKVTELMTEIKKEIAEKDPATREDVEEIVKEQLDNLEIELSDEDRQLLIDLFDKIKDLDIDFDKVKDQLEDIASTLKDKFEDIEIDEGFWEKVKSFFNDLIDSIASIFK